MTLVWKSGLNLQSPASNDPLLDLNTQPSLDLQFAAGKTLDDRVSGNNLVTFSRASTGTYVGSDGLIKTSPVNLLTYSNLITSANWTFSRLSAPTSATTEIDSPVSGSSVFKLLETTDTGEHYFRKTSAVPIASSTTVTTSLYINTSLGRSKVRVYSFALNNLTFIWDLVNNAEISLTGGTAATVESTPIGNNWYRLKWTDIATANNDFKPSIMSVTDSNQFSFAGDTSKGFYITGYQIEEGSTATTYIPTTTSASGAPRFDHDPVTGESLGLLIEESRTNDAFYSNDFTQWVTTATGGVNPAPVLVPASGVSPSGLTDATEITYPAVSVANSYSIVYLRPGTSGNTQYVFSAYLKGTVGGETIYLMSTANGINWASQSFTLTTDWERCVFPHTTLGTNSYFQIGVDLRDGAQSGQPAQVISVWGAQVEEGSFPTSYIPTTGTTVTRAADLASIEGTNFSSWYNQSEGTVFVDRTFNINNGQTYYFTDSVLVLNRVRLEGINHYGNNSSDGSSFNTAAASNKTALGLQTDNVSVNGGTPDTSFTMPSSLDRLFIGRHPTVSSYLNGHIARLAYYPYRLADATLQEITS